MKLQQMYEYSSQTRLDYPVEEVFKFFSKAENLEIITPSFLGFRIMTQTPILMEKGTLIDYKIKIHGLPIRWRTRISEWEPPYRFVDEQLKGPYRTWIHQHTFEPIEDGSATLMKDHVKYSIFAGPLVNPFVRKDIAAIFDYRKEMIASLFPERANRNAKTRTNV